MPEFKVAAEEFVVEEIPRYRPSGRGRFLWLLVEKTGLDTWDAAKRLSSAFDVPQKAVGFAGRKDRHAVTRQWFSIARNEPDAETAGDEPEGVTILERGRHHHGLALGDLDGNRFEITIRDVSEPEAVQARTALDRVTVRGLPNRFGPQRYGRDGKNAERGRRLLSGERLSIARHERRFCVAALQSEAFDRIVERREIDRFLPGDLAWRHLDGRVVPVPEPERVADELARFEFSPTGPLFGPKTRMASREAGAIEREVLAEYGIDRRTDLGLLRELRLSGGRRPLRVPVEGARFDVVDDRAVLAVELPSGSYATVLLEVLFPDGLVDRSRSAG